MFQLLYYTHIYIYIYIYTLRLFNIAMENGPFIDGLPIKNGGSFHGKLLNNQMVHSNYISMLFLSISGSNPESSEFLHDMSTC